jgi:hypothetical protein
MTCCEAVSKRGASHVPSRIEVALLDETDDFRPEFARFIDRRRRPLLNDRFVESAVVIHGIV